MSDNGEEYVIIEHRSGGSFGTFVPIPILAEPEQDYRFDAAQLERDVAAGAVGIFASGPGQSHTFGWSRSIRD